MKGYGLTGLLLFAAIQLSGCTLEPVRPWDRNLLAKPTMQLVPDTADGLLDEHIYFSKESSFGGASIGGGGCGCN